MTALERAARAAWVERGHNPDEMLMCNPPRRAYMQLIPTIRAVLMAVREPDRDTLLAIAAESYTDSSGYTRWQAGIDAILNEKDTTND